MLTRQDWRPHEDTTRHPEINPGFSRRLAAHWELRVDRTGAYDIVVRLQPGRFGLGARADVHVSLDDRTLTTPRVVGWEVYRFDAVPLDRGDLTLRAWSGEASGELDAALYVDVRAR